MLLPPSLQVAWGLSTREVGSGGLGDHEVLLLSPHRWCGV